MPLAEVESPFLPASSAAADRPASRSLVPALSVAMPVYNGRRFLAAALDSVLNQTFANFELLIIDDGSRDDSGIIIERFARSDKRVRHYRLTHHGIPASLNFALERARGRYFAIMDQDDVSHPERFMRQFAFLEMHPDVGVLGTGSEIIDEDGRLIRCKRYPVASGAVAEALPTSCPVLHPASMMRTDLVRAVGGYRSAFRFAFDYDLWLRLSRRTELANLPDLLLMKRHHRAQVTRDRSNKSSQVAFGAGAFLSHYSTINFGHEAFTAENDAPELAAFLISRLSPEAISRTPALLHHLSRLMRYAHLRGLRVKVRYIRAVLLSASVSEIARGMFYLLLFLAAALLTNPRGSGAR